MKLTEKNIKVSYISIFSPSSMEILRTSPQQEFPETRKEKGISRRTMMIGMLSAVLAATTEGCSGQHGTQKSEEKPENSTVKEKEDDEFGMYTDWVRRHDACEEEAGRLHQEQEELTPLLQKWNSLDAKTLLETEGRLRTYNESAWKLNKEIDERGFHHEKKIGDRECKPVMHVQWLHKP